MSATTGPIHDFRCPHGHVHEARTRDKERECPECGATAVRVFLTMPAFDYSRMAMGDGCQSAIDRFERVHREQRAKEERSYEEHGDYGPMPGGDGGSDY